MNTTGIISEYNPFHNGHAYQLACAKKDTDADALIVVMSGNFVQRGAPALLDKFSRTKMALLSGADLVLELPVLWATASAEYFAGAGVALLEQLGCVNTLCYGCESPDSALFHTICRISIEASNEYHTLLSQYLKEGINYALARERTLLSLLPPGDSDAIKEILRNPNNILALEYQKAIAATNSSLNIYPILRKGQSYHSDTITAPLASASAIRNYLQKKMPALNDEILAGTMPHSALQILTSYADQYPFLYDDDCSEMLLYCLLGHAAEGFEKYADCTTDFSNKICKNLNQYISFHTFCELLKTKDITYTRISRILLHILLDLQKTDYTYWRSHHYMPYARILGFRKEAAGLLSHIKKYTTIPLLTRAADAKKILSKEPELAFFQKNLFSDAVYRGIAAQKGGQIMPDEFRQQIVVV